MPSKVEPRPIPVPSPAPEIVATVRPVLRAIVRAARRMGWTARVVDGRVLIRVGKTGLYWVGPDSRFGPGICHSVGRVLDDGRFGWLASAGHHPRVARQLLSWLLDHVLERNGLHW